MYSGETSRQLDRTRPAGPFEAQGRRELQGEEEHKDATLRRDNRSAKTRLTDNVPFLRPFLRQGRQDKQDGAPAKARR
jgi:hypothetical protein